MGIGGENPTIFFPFFLLSPPFDACHRLLTSDDSNGSESELAFFQFGSLLFQLTTWESYPSSERGRQLSIKREMRHFHVVVVQKKMESSCFASGVLDFLGLRNRIMAYFAIVGENEAWVDFFWYSLSCLFSSWCSYVKKGKEVCIKTRSSSARILTIVY